MSPRNVNNLDALLGQDEQSAAARRGISRAEAAARTARGSAGRSSDDAEARRIAILKHERRRAAALALKQRSGQNIRQPGPIDAPQQPQQLATQGTLWRRLLAFLRRSG